MAVVKIGHMVVIMHKRFVAMAVTVPIPASAHASGCDARRRGYGHVRVLGPRADEHDDDVRSYEGKRR